MLGVCVVFAMALLALDGTSEEDIRDIVHHGVQ
jgi:hypothetical protein